MAIASEIHSLDDIQYKSKVRPIFWVMMTLILFTMAFLNTYPIGIIVKDQLKKNLAGSCHPDFNDIHMEWFLPKIVISDLSIPANCLGKQGESIKLSMVKINYQLINFSPLGLPFRIDTEISGQPLSIYFVLGLGEQMIRIKDQNLVLSRLAPVLGDHFKMLGSVTTDLNLLMSNNVIKNLEFKTVSKNFSLPAQKVSGFGLPGLKLNEFYIEVSGAYPKLSVDKMILGDSNSPLRANLKGKIDMQEAGLALSPIQLTGEIFLSQSLKESAGWLELLVQSFPQKDGFYQVKLGGTLSSPQPLAQ